MTLSLERTPTDGTTDYRDSDGPSNVVGGQKPRPLSVFRLVSDELNERTERTSRMYNSNSDPHRPLHGLHRPLLLVPDYLYSPVPVMSEFLNVARGAAGQVEERHEGTAVPGPWREGHSRGTTSTWTHGAGTTHSCGWPTSRTLIRKSRRSMMVLEGGTASTMRSRDTWREGGRTHVPSHA